MYIYAYTSTYVFVHTCACVKVISVCVDICCMCVFVYMCVFLFAFSPIIISQLCASNNIQRKGVYKYFTSASTFHHSICDMNFADDNAFLQFSLYASLRNVLHQCLILLCLFCSDFVLEINFLGRLITFFIHTSEIIKHKIIHLYSDIKLL